MSSHSYAANFPSFQFDPAIKTFYESFYAASDKPDVIESYADFFTPDASLTMASRSVTGRQDIITFRQGMWATVTSRKHTIYKIIPFGENSYEVAIFGKVDYTLTNGKDIESPWAANAELVKSEGDLKMQRYQVYLVRTSTGCEAEEGSLVC